MMPDKPTPASFAELPIKPAIERLHAFPPARQHRVPAEARAAFLQKRNDCTLKLNPVREGGWRDELRSVAHGCTTGLSAVADAIKPLCLAGLLERIDRQAEQPVRWHMNRAVHCAAFDARYIFGMRRVVEIDIEPSSARQRGVHRVARRAAAHMVRLHALNRVNAR